MEITKHTFGKALTLLGVLAWVPLLLLTFGGYSPSILPFLAVHLIGILGGVWFKRTEQGGGASISLTGKSLSRKLGSYLVLIGAAVWIPFIAINNLTVAEVSLAPFVTLHLSAVVPGILLRLGLFDRVRNTGFRRRKADEPSPSLD